MRPFGALAEKIVMTEALALALGLAAAVGTGSLGQFSPGSLALAVLCLWIFVCLVTLLVLRFATRAVRGVLSKEPSAQGQEGNPKVVAQAIALPATISFTLLVVGLLGLVVILLVSNATAVIAFDLSLAYFGVGFSASLLGAMLGYSLTARTVASLLERIGNVDARRLGSMRSKILVLTVGLGVVGVSLVSSAGYVRYRESLASEVFSTVGSRVDVTVLERPDRSAADLAWALNASTGYPAAVFSVEGKVLAVSGEVPESLTNDYGKAMRALHKAGGITVTHWVRPLGYVEVYVGEQFFGERLRAFGISLFVAVVVTLLGTFVLAYAAAGAITLPLRTLGRAADRVSAGDLTTLPASVSGDEMGGLAAQFRGMVEGLSGLVREVQLASGSVSKDAREVGAIGDRVRRGAVDQHAGVYAMQQAVTSMEGSMSLVSRRLGALSEYVSATTRAVSDMAEAFDGVQHRAVEMEKAMESSIADVERLGSAGHEAEARLSTLDALAAKAGGTLAEVKASVAGLERAASESEATAVAVSEVSEKAGTVMEETVRGIEDLRHTVADAHQRIAVLGRRSDDIDQVVDFISEVAGRTNLLSLNASIIAAQAGEHGKAFAVVADQIRDLASQIARSTTSIGDIIRAVREDVEGTASLIERGDALASEGVQLVRNSLEALSAIQGSTQRARETASAIRTAVQSQANSSRDVATVVEHVAEGSRAVAAAVQLVGRSVGGVHTVSRGVSGTADKVARTLEEQGGLARRQLENLSQLETMIEEITKAVEDHAAATQQVQTALEALTGAAGEHESAVSGLSGVAEHIGLSARTLAERINRFRV